MSSAEPKSSGPSIAVEVTGSSDGRIGCTVTFRNETDAELTIWDEGSSWGDAALFFEVQQGGRTEQLQRREQLYTRNFPRTAALPAGGSQERTVALTAEEWEPGEAFDRLGDADAQLRAVYRSGDSAEVEQEGVWAGTVSSPFVPVRP
jgi:hypothetical protein